eukprot:CAMPEP_0116877804 /NCGR_PEP_ID=MMETSP0463-20121206/9546_1 /TAXON_ID=181622 /ORGANISM="Strombidinopsis sp, Strain SopsisLIS2011" /LENGTH=121 /DNA_ID=CAMNT_0004525375 /DNA_START=1386 /DNA_END=1751 /DNA_ORIENTATION=-
MTYMKLEKSVQAKYTGLVCVFTALFSLLNFYEVNLLQGLWELVGSIVCPLIILVLPGCFFHSLQKDLRPKVEESNSGSKYSRAMKKCQSRMGAPMAIFGLFILPVFMTLATKNLFEGNQST